MTTARRHDRTARYRTGPFDLTPEDFDAELFAQLYSKLATGFSAAQTVAERSGALLSLMVPGQYVKQNLDPDDPGTQYVLSNLLNPTLACSWVVQRGAANVTEVYEAVLNGKEPPLTHLTERQRQDLAAARALVFQPDGAPTARYERYLACRLAYLEASAAYEQALATERNGGRKVPPRLRKALDRAVERWRVDGDRDGVDLAFATIDQYDALEPALFWQRLGERFGQWTRPYGVGGHYQHVDTAPPYREWFTDDGWSDFTFDELDFAHQDRSGGAGLEPCRCRCGDGPAPARGGFHQASTAEFDGGLRLPTAVPTRFRLTCELRRVEIARPWLDPLVLHSRAWRWSRASGTYGVRISTGGDLVGSLVPTGVMPLLPTAAVLARKVEIEWSDGGSWADRLAAPNGPELRFGPFRLTGATAADDHISMPDPQLVGYLSEVLPRCPDPDPRLPWPDDPQT
ncbi:hypothetical protein AB0I91_33825 [Actinosynnema sp. NPDC049800]